MSYNSAFPASAQNPPVPSTTHPSPLSASQHLVDVFVRPIRLFEQLRREPAWTLPLLTAIAVGILVIVLLPDQVFVDSMQGATTRRGVPVTITSDPDVIARWERIRLSLGVFVTHPVKALMLGGFLTLVFGKLLGGAGGFREHFAIAAHVLLISALGALLALPFQVSNADPSWQPSLALLLPNLATLGVIGRVLVLVNPFTLWMLVTAAIGVAVVNRRSAALPVGLLLGLYLAVLTAIAAIQA
jgi:hypothetical protein